MRALPVRRIRLTKIGTRTGGARMSGTNCKDWIGCSTVARSNEQTEFCCRRGILGCANGGRRMAVFGIVLALLAAPSASPGAEVIVYPWDYGWFTYLPVWGFVGVTPSNPRSGFGSLELMKPVGGGGAYINWTVSYENGTWGTLSVL